MYVLPLDHSKAGFRSGMRSSPLRSGMQRGDLGSILAGQAFGRRRAEWRIGIWFGNGSLMGEILDWVGHPGAELEFGAAWDLRLAPLLAAPACMDDAGW